MKSQLDEDFVSLVESKKKTEIKELAQGLSKHEKIRIDKWVEKLNMPIVNPVWKQNRNNYCKVLFAMLRSSKIEQPFNKLPPDGPLQKIKPPVHQNKEVVNSQKVFFKSENTNKDVEFLQKELEKCLEREQFLKDELIMSARIINEQDKIIVDLRNRLQEETLEDFEYLDELKGEADALAWSSELVLSQDEPVESPSMDDVKEIEYN